MTGGQNPMDEDTLMQVLVDWNLWEKEQETGIERPKYAESIEPFLKTDQAVVVTGVRRSGKSTLMLQLAETLIEKGKEPENLLYVNLEDYRFTEYSLELLEQIYELYLKSIAGEGQKIIFLDEIHKIPEWERFARTLLDRKEARLVVSGSNSRLISEEYASLLTGRHVNFEMMPLSFEEYLEFNGLELGTEVELQADRIEAKKQLDNYLEYGSFPAVALSPEKTRFKMLGDYFESIITRDVVERHNIRKTQSLRSLARFYLTNISNLITFNRTSENLEIPLTTVERFSRYLEQSYILNFVKRFSFKVKEQENAPRKVYSIDTGLTNSVGFQFMEKKGCVLENAVYLELAKRNIRDPQEIYYWQDQRGKEVDFVVKNEKDIKKLIQVCYDPSDPSTMEREIKALLKAGKKLDCDNLKVITYDYSDEVVEKGVEIQLVPFWSWAVELSDQ